MRNFDNIEMRAIIKFFFPLQCKAPKKIHAILTETLACFRPGRAKDLSEPPYTELEPIKGSLSVTRTTKNRPNSALVKRYWERRKTCPSTLPFFYQKKSTWTAAQASPCRREFTLPKDLFSCKTWAIFIRRYKIKQ